MQVVFPLGSGFAAIQRLFHKNLIKTKAIHKFIFQRRSNLESFKDILEFEERHDSSYRMVTDNQVQTKRQLLSAIAQVYDPLGSYSTSHPSKIVIANFMENKFNMG